VCAARAPDQVRVAKAHHQLLEIGARQVLLLGDFAQADGPVPWRRELAIKRTPYSPFVEKETAPVLCRCAWTILAPATAGASFTANSDPYRRK